MWESSPRGGCWVVKLWKDRSVDLKWEQLLLACIGERFNDLNVIGVVLSLRFSVDIIQLWMKEKQKAEVFGALLEVLGLNARDAVIYYKEHGKSMVVSVSMRKVGQLDHAEPQRLQAHQEAAAGIGT